MSLPDVHTRVMVGSCRPPVGEGGGKDQIVVVSLSPRLVGVMPGRDVDLQPPMLCISVGPRDDGDLDKDTLSNVEETGEFVINIVSLSLSNTMFESSKNHPPEADEFEKAGLTPAPCEVVGAPRVEEAG